MGGYILGNKSVYTKKPVAELAFGFLVETVFSPSRPSLDAWV